MQIALSFFFLIFCREWNKNIQKMQYESYMEMEGSLYCSDQIVLWCTSNWYMAFFTGFYSAKALLFLAAFQSSVRITYRHLKRRIIKVQILALVLMPKMTSWALFWLCSTLLIIISPNYSFIYRKRRKQQRKSQHGCNSFWGKDVRMKGENYQRITDDFMNNTISVAGETILVSSVVIICSKVKKKKTSKNAIVTKRDRHAIK